MKKYFFLLLLACLGGGSTLLGQARSYQDIPLGVSLPSEMDSVPLSARNLLINRLQQAATQTGGPAGVNPRFVIATTIATLNRTIVAGTAPQIVRSMELNVYIVDFFERKIFTSVTIPLKGVGRSDNQAYTAAFRQLSASDPRLTGFLIDSRQRIGTYYEQYCGQVLKRAENLVVQRQFEEAFHTLAIVPESCPACYEQANDMIAATYQAYMDNVCSRNLAQAQALWVSGQNALNATKAAEYLMKILPDAACYEDAQRLMGQMEAKGIEENWDFKMVQYFNDLQFQWQKHNDAVSLERQRIEAARQVGIEEARNQPDILVNSWSLFGWGWFVW